MGKEGRQSTISLRNHHDEKKVLLGTGRRKGEALGRKKKGVQGKGNRGLGGVQSVWGDTRGGHKKEAGKTETGGPGFRNSILRVMIGNGTGPLRKGGERSGGTEDKKPGRWAFV